MCEFVHHYQYLDSSQPSVLCILGITNNIFHNQNLEDAISMTVNMNVAE